MGYSSQPGQVGFGVQSVKGTPVAASRFARLRSGSLGADRSLIVPDPEIGGNRDIPGAYMGPVGFSGDLEFYVRMQMAALLLRGVLGASSSASVAGTNEIQTITITGAPTGGTFQLRFRSETTAPINWNATSANVKTALDALASLAPGDTTAAGGPLPTTPVTITFTGTYAAENVPPITAVTPHALTGGTTPTVAVTTTTPGVGVIGTHTITPADTLPWLTVEERIGTGLESFRYTDGKVNSLRFEADATGLLTGSANIAALTQISGFTAQATPAWDISPMVVGSQIAVVFNSVQLPGKSFNLEITNQIETDDFVMGSIYAADMTEKRREVRAGLTYRPQDANLWKAAMYGAEAATSPNAGPAFKAPMTITISTFETIGGTDPGGTPYSMTFEFPEAVITPFKITPSGDDVIQNDIEITATRSDPVLPLMTAVVKNDLSTVT